MRIALRWLARASGLLRSSLGPFVDRMLAAILQYGLRYRNQTIWQNLTRAFPDKNKTELSQLRTKFYRHLARTLLVSLAAMEWKEEEIRAKIRFADREAAHKMICTPKPLIMIGGHQGSWELVALRIALDARVPVTGVYKPIKSPSVDQYLKMQRGRFGMKLVPVRHTAKLFLKYGNQASLFFMLGDQSPDNMKEAIWNNFLGQDTAWLHGLERYSRKLQAAVVFFACIPEPNDQYCIQLEWLTNDAAKLETGEITRLYAKALENSIRSMPENWLWSHKRWKRNRKEAGS